MEPRRDETTKQSGDTPTIRMMVLETDKPHKETESRRGNFGAILHKHFTDAGAAHDPPLGIETDRRFVVTEQGGKMPKFEDFEGCKAVLITGSMYDAHGENPWILELLELLESESPSDSTFRADSDSRQNSGNTIRKCTFPASVSDTNSYAVFSAPRSPQHRPVTGSWATAKSPSTPSA